MLERIILIIKFPLEYALQVKVTSGKDESKFSVSSITS